MKPLHARDEIIDAYHRIVGDGAVTELRALNAVVDHSKYSTTYAGYFNNGEALAQSVSRIRQATGIYFIPNPVDPALIARANNRIKRANRGESTQDTNIVCRRWLLIDIDADRPAGISATDAEHEAAKDRARPELLDVEAVGKLLTCSQRTVYRLADAGKMPRPVRLGSLVRWDRETLLAWIRDGCKPVRRATGARR